MESVDDFETPQIESAITETIDLDGIERDLADVETALARLDAGTYWQCEETGRALSDELMESNPIARRVATS